MHFYLYTYLRIEQNFGTKKRRAHMAGYDVSMAHGSRSVAKLAEQIASGALTPDEVALALSLCAQQLHDEAKCEQGVDNDLLELSLLLLQGDPSPVVRARAARVCGALTRVAPGAARLASRTGDR